MRHGRIIAVAGSLACAAALPGGAPAGTLAPPAQLTAAPANPHVVLVGERRWSKWHSAYHIAGSSFYTNPNDPDYFIIPRVTAPPGRGPTVVEPHPRLKPVIRYRKEEPAHVHNPPHVNKKSRRDAKTGATTPTH